MKDKISVICLIGAIFSMVSWLIFSCASIIGFIDFVNFDQELLNSNVGMFLFHKLIGIGFFGLVLFAFSCVIFSLLTIIKSNQPVNYFTIVCFKYNLLGLFGFIPLLASASAPHIIYATCLLIAEILFITSFIIYKIRKHRSKKENKTP